MDILSPESVLLAALIIIFAEWGHRIVWMAQFRKGNPPIQPAKFSAKAQEAPKISVIIPARNEEKNIARCLISLTKQSYPNIEILVVDDRSDDRTGHLVDNLSKISTIPIRRVRVEKLPAGWTGKNHAMVVGSKAATGEWFLFTDADTTHFPDSVSSSIQKALSEKIDFLTLAPEVECITFWENVVQPLAVSSLALWFNSPRILKSEKVLANGQYILVRRDVYESVGGNECVKQEVVEDVELAKKIKQKGFSVMFQNGTRLYSTRMYTSLSQIKTGWTRIFIHLFEKKLVPIFHKIFLFLFFSLLPFAILVWQGTLLAQRDPGANGTLFWLSLTTSFFIIAVRFVGNIRLRSNPWYSALHPLGSLVMIWILSICAYRIIGNRPSVWRGDMHV